MQRNIFEGSDFLLYDIDNNPVALSNNCALKTNNSQVDITTKDSQNWKESMSAIKDWSIEFEGLVSYGSSGLTTSFFLTQFQIGDPFFIQMGVIQQGFTHTFWGEVAIDSINIDADNGEVASYSGSLKGVGQLEFTNNGTPAQSGYLKVESDPVFRGSAAFNITNTNKTDWTDAYNKTLQSLGFATVGNQTTLSLTLRDGSVYSAPFNQIGGSGGGLTSLSFNTSNGVLTANSLTTNFDGRYQLAGNYVGLQYLTDNYYSQSQIDNKGYLTSVNWSDVMAKPTSLSQFINDSGFITTYNEVDTLDSVLGRGNTSNKDISVSGKAKFSTSLSIPTAAPNSPVSGEHYLYSTGNFGSTGSTGGGGGTYDYNDLINKPTLLSQFINNLGNYGGWSTADGLNATGTWGINITGNANTASQWNGQSYLGTDISTVQTYILAYGNDNKWHPTSNGAVRNFLGLGSIAYENHLLYHRYGGFGSDAYTADEHTSSFTYGVNAPFNGYLGHFGANGYGLQINSKYHDGGGRISFRSRNGDLNAWNNWQELWHTGNLTPSVAAAGNSVVQRDPNGYIFNSYLNTTDDVQSSNLGYLVGKLTGGDNYHRSFTAGAVQNFLGLNTGAYNDYTRLQSVSHPTTFWISNAWDGTYWQLTNNHGSPVNVGHSNNADYATNAGYAVNETLQTITNRGAVTNNRTQFLGVSGHFGSNTYQGGIEIQQPNAGITFHYPGNYASQLWMGSSGILTWEGAGINTSTITGGNYVYGANYVQGGRVIAGYDSGVAGSINASGWFRSNGATGWLNGDYGGGIYMADSTYIRTYGGKQFYCDNRILSPTIEAQAALIIPTAPPSNPESGKHYLYSIG